MTEFANGPSGVENVLDILRDGIDPELVGVGKSSLRELGAEDLHVPKSFARRLGVPGEFVSCA